MPFTISICGKGGVGKTTTTVMLGVGLHRAGQNTMLVDVDEQATLSRTWAGGAEPSADLPAVVYMSASTVARDLKKVAGQCDVIVVDTPAGLGVPTRTVMELSDLVLLPVGRGFAGLAALSEAMRIVDKARERRPELDARVVLNFVDHTTLSATTRERVKKMGLPTVGSGFRDLVVYDEAMSLGGTDVVGYAPDSDAAKECKRLVSDVLKIVKGRK